MKMKRKMLFPALLLVAATAAFANGQVRIEVKPDQTQSTANELGRSDDYDLVDQVFSPITTKLNLTAEQRFRIASIASITMIQADSLFEELDDLDAQLSTAAFSGRLNESQIRDLSEKQANLLGQVIAMKARAKMSFYRILTDEQRALVVGQYRRPTEGSIGSVSN
jgi:LTXXQ motif family protein